MSSWKANWSRSSRTRSRVEVIAAPSAAPGRRTGGRSSGRRRDGGSGMQALILGIVLMVLGGAVAMYGTRLFYVLLPAWAFLAGFVLGADLFATLFGEAFLATI